MSSPGGDVQIYAIFLELKVENGEKDCTFCAGDYMSAIIMNCVLNMMDGVDSGSKQYNSYLCKHTLFSKIFVRE